MHVIFHKRGPVLTGCGQRNKCSTLKATARDHRERAEDAGNAPRAAGIRGVQDLEVTARKGFRSTQNSKASLYVCAGGSSHTCPLQVWPGWPGKRRDQSRTHHALTKPSLKRRSDWLRGDQAQQAGTDGERLRRHTGVHVDRQGPQRQITWKCMQDGRPSLLPHPTRTKNHSALGARCTWHRAGQGWH